MRYVIEFKLPDSTILSAVVSNARSEKEAAMQAIKASSFCFNSKKLEKFRLTESTQYRIEKWKDTGKVVNKQGYFKCSVSAFYNQNDIKTDNISRAQGVRTTYNLILSYYPVTPIVVFIYDSTQKPQKQRASFVAKITLKNEKATKYLLYKFEKELATIPIAGEYLVDIPLLFSMIIDYQKGVYREVPVSVIIGVVGAIAYVVSPIDLIPDIIPFIGQLDDVTVVMWVLKQFHKEIQGYKNWRQKHK